MIQYVKGNLLTSKAVALVNTVNTVGVMGKGIALQFKQQYPNNYKIYRDACKNGSFKTGDILVVEEGDLLNKKIIINFPTKAHWRNKSKYEYITLGLEALKKVIEAQNIKSIAIPPLGCGNGGFDWIKVKQLLEAHLQDIDCEIFIYEPSNDIKSSLQQDKTIKDVKLTPARAMLLYLMFQYEALGESSSLFVANKLAWFLQRSGENLRLKFKAHHYGPYAVQLNHVLLYLNGVYLKGLEQNVSKPFEPLLLNYDRYTEVEKYINTQLSTEQRQRLKDVVNLLKGFESAFSLELLSTVDFLSMDNSNKNVDAIIKAIAKWSNRKTDLFQPRQIQIAYNHLQNHASQLMI